jgi:hypothetical protein
MTPAGPRRRGIIIAAVVQSCSFVLMLLAASLISALESLSNGPIWAMWRQSLGTRPDTGSNPSRSRTNNEQPVVIVGQRRIDQPSRNRRTK